MARKTKAEKLAEQEALRQVQEKQARQEFIPLLMKLLEQAQRFGYEVGVKEGKLTLSQPFHREAEFTFGLEWNWINQTAMEELEMRVIQLKCEQEEEWARIAAKQAALNKLTAEERKLLGL